MQPFSIILFATTSDPEGEGIQDFGKSKITMRRMGRNKKGSQQPEKSGFFSFKTVSVQPIQLSLPAKLVQSICFL
jgi:hypothetical protein